MNVESRAEIVLEEKGPVLQLGSDKAGQTTDPAEMKIARRMADVLLADDQLLNELFGE